MKKIFIIFITLIVLLFAGYFIYGFFIAPTGTGDGPEETGQEGRSFDPFGFLRNTDEREDGAGDSELSDDSINNFENSAPQTPERLVLLSETPVAGITAGERNGEEMFRYVDRATAHVSDFYATSSKRVRVSNTTIPRIQEVAWGNLDTLALRYLDTDVESVVTFVARIVPPTSTTSDSVGELGGTFFPRDIDQLTFSSTGDEVLYLRNDDGAFITKASLDNSVVENVLSSPISQWLLEWGRQQTATITTKPSNTVLGQAYILNTNTGSQTSLVRDVRGLTTLTNEKATKVLYSGSNDSFNLHIKSIDSGEIQDGVVSTLPEKCVWGEEDLYCAVPQTLFGNLPDSWYQGRAFFSDTLWKIDLETGFAEFVFSPQQFDQSLFDMTLLTLTPSEEHVAFINKRDGSLWMYKLVQTDTVSEDEGVSSVDGDE